MAWSVQLTFLLLLLPLIAHSQLSCIAGTSVMTISFNSSDAPPSEQCPADEEAGCLRVDATATFPNAGGEVETVSTTFGQCVSDAACQDACSDAIRQLIFDEINSAIQLDPDTLEVVECEAFCCDTDNCNALSVAELLAARGGGNIMTSSVGLLVTSLLAYKFL